MIPITRVAEPSTLVNNKSVWLTELLQAIAIFNSATDSEAKKAAEKEVTKKQISQKTDKNGFIYYATW